MKTNQVQMTGGKWDPEKLNNFLAEKPDLVFLFGSLDYFQGQDLSAWIKDHLAGSTVIGCSTAGEISEKGVFDKSLVFTSAKFEANTTTKIATSQFDKNTGIKKCGEELGEKLSDPNLKAVFVLSQGIDVNGTELIEGLVNKVGSNVLVTGGLAGDEGAFLKTFTIANHEISSSNIVAVGLYGENLEIGYGSMGGWEPFGPVRKVTKAKGNMLFELDGEPALEVYKKYLGPKANELPAAGLLYPFAVLNETEDTTGIIRTILGIDEKEGSLTLAGDIHEGGSVRLMHTETAGLVDGAKGAADKAHGMLKSQNDGISLLVSCVGRKLVMGDDTDDEVDAVKSIFGDLAKLTGFYSYGEICPFLGFTDCKLHNQTMTITHITEKKVS